MFSKLFEDLRSLRDDSAFKRAVIESTQDKDVGKVVVRGIIAAKHAFRDNLHVNITLIEWLDSENLSYLQEIAMACCIRPVNVDDARQRARIWHMRKRRAFSRVFEAAQRLMYQYTEELIGSDALDDAIFDMYLNTRVS
jgi:hypothetical protein